MAWNKHCVVIFTDVLQKKLPESTVRCPGIHDITEITLAMALKNIQSIYVKSPLSKNKNTVLDMCGIQTFEIKNNLPYDVMCW